jgi:phosphoribosylglycinamide formyltransferase-1
VTVFLVDDGMDTGPVVLQEPIEVREDDDWDSLEARVHEVEHRLLPAATAALVEGRIHVDGRKVTIDGGPS